MVIKRSFQEPIERVLMMAGTAHATPEINGTTDLPFSPKRRINLSMMNITLDIYPVSSNKEMNKNRKAICGMKINTPPIPAIKPSVNKPVRLVSGKIPCNQSFKAATPPTMASIGIVAHVNTA